MLENPHERSNFCIFNLRVVGSRILHNTNSLVVRVLKCKYWKIGSFMDCGLGTRPSFTWRSIFHEIDMLDKEMVIKIGDGNSTKVWTDNWYIDLIPRYVIDVPPKRFC